VRSNIKTEREMKQERWREAKKRERLNKRREREQQTATGKH